MASKKGSSANTKAKLSAAVIKPIETFSQDNNLIVGPISVSYKWLFYGLLACFAIILLAGATRVRVVADEAIDYEYGKAALKYFTTHGKDTTYAHLHIYKSNFPNQKYYGSFVEMMAPAIAKLSSRINGLKVHHIISALFCLLLLFFTGQLARIIINNRAAVLALLLIGLTPQILGNGFFNTKDIPFAAAYTMSIYFSIRLFQSFPKLDWRLIAGWVTSLALAIAVRVGGIVLIPLTGCFALLALFTTPLIKQTASNVKQKWFAVLTASIVVAVVLAGITYPNFWHMGFTHFTKALNNFKQFPVKITMLYEGELLLSTKVDTGSFLLNYIFISFPELVLLLTAIGTVLLIKSPYIKKSVGWFIVLAAWFPVCYIIAIGAFIYNGWRHVMFAYPCMIIISVYALSYFYQKFKSRAVIGYTVTALVIIGLIDLGLYNVQAFPYNYFYFNHLEGGVSAAYNTYDIDYQQLATTDAFDWLVHNTDISTHKTNRVFSNNPLALIYYTQDTVKYKPFQTKLVDMFGLKWDYAIVSNNFEPVNLIKFEYPPQGTIYTLKRFGVPLAYVVKRQEEQHLDSLNLIDKGKYDSAAPILERVYKANPKDLFNMHWLAFCYYKLNNYKESVRLLDTLSKYHPKQVDDIELYGYNYYNMKRYEEAASCISSVYSTRPNYLVYNQILCGSLMMLGHKKEAQPYLAKIQQEQQQGQK